MDGDKGRFPEQPESRVGASFWVFLTIFALGVAAELYILLTLSGDDPSGWTSLFKWGYSAFIIPFIMVGLVGMFYQASRERRSPNMRDGSAAVAILPNQEISSADFTRGVSSQAKDDMKTLRRFFVVFIVLFLVGVVPDWFFSQEGVLILGSFIPGQWVFNFGVGMWMGLLGAIFYLGLMAVLFLVSFIGTLVGLVMVINHGSKNDYAGYNRLVLWGIGIAFIVITCAIMIVPQFKTPASYDDQYTMNSAQTMLLVV